MYLRENYEDLIFKENDIFFWNTFCYFKTGIFTKEFVLGF